jgi:hypothetical protein
MKRTDYTIPEKNTNICWRSVHEKIHILRNTRLKAEWMHSNPDLAINYNSSLKSSGLLFLTGSRGNSILGKDHYLDVLSIQIRIVK